MKVVFLDCDGVISPLSGGQLFTKPLMGRLKRIIAESGAVIVLSSSWRTSEFGREEVRRQLVGNGIPPFIDITPDIPGKTRSVEILTWLELNKEKLHVVNFVALDDIPLSQIAPDTKFFTRHAIQTNSFKGLTDADVALAIEMLSDSNNFSVGTKLL